MIDPWVASISALPVLVAAVSSNFYFVGTSSPGKLLLLETLPRAVGTAFAALLMSIGVLSAVGGVAVQLLATILAIMTSALAILGWRRPAHWFVDRVSERPGLGALFRRQRAGVFSGLWTSALSNSPLLVVSVVSLATLPAFSVIDKLVKQIVAGSSPLTSVLQGWVPAAGAGSIPRRVRVALVGAWVGSAFVFFAVGLVARPLVVWTSAGQVAPGLATVLLMAGLVSLFLLQNAISYACLAPLGRLRAVNVSLVVGGIAGIVAIILLVPVLGLDGALLGSGTGLTLTVVMQTAFSLIRLPLR